MRHVNRNEMTNAASGLLLCALIAGTAACSGLADEDELGEPGYGEQKSGTFLLEEGPVELDYELIDGRMMFEEDIILDPEDEIVSGPNTATNGLFAVSSNSRLWPRGVVPYKIHSSVTTPGRVKKAMQEWEDKTSIRFVPRTTQAAFVVFKEEPGNGTCQANVGYTGGKRVVYLRDTSIRSACSKGIIIHEIGHILGLWHEHTRSDRDQYVKVIWNNVGNVAAFKKKTTGVRKVGPYDIKSTMHYRSFSLSSPTNKPSIKKLDGSLLLHDWADLSKKDIAAMAVLYPGR